MPHIYHIDKSSGTSADTLLALGLARMLQTMLNQLGRGSEADAVWVCDEGSRYAVKLPTAISDGDIADLKALPFVQHLDTANQASKLGTHYGAGFAYDEQRELRNAYREKRKELPASARSPDAVLRNDPALEALRPYEPSTLLPVYLVISQMKTAPSFNEPVIRWRELSPELLRKHVRLLLDLFSVWPNPLAETIADWKLLAKKHSLGDAEMTMLQVINPTAGKGSTRAKADALTIGNLSAFWPLELLKFAGFFAVAHPQVIANAKDRKTYIVRPKNIQISVLDQLMRTFRSALWSNSPAKIDVLAVLQFTRALVIQDRNALQQEGGFLAPWEALPPPAERIHGFDVAFYKDMGSAYAVMNVATLNLPNWLPAIEQLEQAYRILALLEEHTTVIGSIRARDGEERTEEYELLRRYRDFLSAHDVDAFLDFAALFAPYISHKLERNEYIYRFSVESLKELFAMAVQQDFVRVIDNPGFQNIADAIRRSTVTLQFIKGSGKRPPFDIRYGLAQELVRSANDADGFIAALGEFVSRYNGETAQTYETSKGSIVRKRITEDDLTAIVRLLAEGFAPKTLARLLVAFGSAKTGSDPDANAPKHEELLQVDPAE
jgi:hypothetical protein